MTQQADQARKQISENNWIRTCFHTRGGPRVSTTLRRSTTVSVPWGAASTIKQLCAELTLQEDRTVSSGEAVYRAVLAMRELRRGGSEALSYARVLLGRGREGDPDLEAFFARFRRR